MRGRLPFWNSSLVCTDRTIRSTVWQLTQLRSDSFCCSFPGTLVIHSPFESWRGSCLVLTSLRSAEGVPPAVTSIERGPWRSYPTARTESVYLPESSFVAGKLKWPVPSLTTVTVTVEPSFLALTRTPSIAPSSCELTVPASADALDCASATSGAPAS